MIANRPGITLEEALPSFGFETRPGLRREAVVKRTTLPPPPGSLPLDPASAQETVPVYLIGNPLPEAEPPMGGPIYEGFFEAAVDSEHLYVYDPEVYIFFCRAVVEMIERLAPDWQPDLIHCNDWHTGLIPAYVQVGKNRAERRAGVMAGQVEGRVTERPATLFTIHNLAYQGDFPHWDWYRTGLPESLYAVEGLEFYGRWTFMKGGLLFADRVNTVSPTYAREIRTPEYGCGLDGLMQTLNAEGRLSGILNGIDTRTFDPQHDPYLPARYGPQNPEGKAACKAALLAELGLPDNGLPVIGMVTRLADQKGLDLIAAVAEQILDIPVQLIVLGQGDARYQRLLAGLQERRPGQVYARIAFDVALAQRIYAGSDLFLMPSRFEPCGLGQMIALRYGTLPIVRATGGLADSIHDFDPVTPETAPLASCGGGNGFVFTDYTPEALLATVRRAVAVWQDAGIRDRLVHVALTSDLAWERSAQRYVELYCHALAASQKNTHHHGWVSGSDS
jgi:starch synthase